MSYYRIASELHRSNNITSAEIKRQGQRDLLRLTFKTRLSQLYAPTVIQALLAAAGFKTYLRSPSQIEATGIKRSFNLVVNHDENSVDISPLKGGRIYFQGVLLRRIRKLISSKQ